MNEQTLVNCGLSIEQAKIYLFLLQNGLLPAKVISLKTGVGRALTYKILDQLMEMKLVEKREDKGRIALFSPAHPQRLKELTESKKAQAEDALASFTQAYGSFASAFNMLQGKPNVQFYEGIDGLKNVYNEILETGEDIKVISSPATEGREDIRSIIKTQIRQQAALGIKTKAITPLKEGGANERTQEDKDNLITRKVVSMEKLNIPAQIIIYGDKVGITNFKDSIITVVIESKYITETFGAMFDYMWGSVE